MNYESVKYANYDGKLYNCNHADSLIQLGTDVFIQNRPIKIADEIFSKKSGFLWGNESSLEEYTKFFKAILSQSNSKAITSLRNGNDTLSPEKLAKKLEYKISKNEGDFGWFKRSTTKIVNNLFQLVNSSIHRLEEKYNRAFATKPYHLSIHRLAIAIILNSLIVGTGIYLGFTALPILASVAAGHFICNRINDLSNGIFFDKDLLWGQILPKYIWKTRSNSTPLELVIKEDVLRYESCQSEKQIVAEAKNLKTLFGPLFDLFTCGIIGTAFGSLEHLIDGHARFRFCPEVKRFGDVRSQWIKLCHTALSENHGFVQIKDGLTYDIRYKADYRKFVADFLIKSSMDNADVKHNALVANGIPTFSEAIPEYHRFEPMTLESSQHQNDSLETMTKLIDSILSQHGGLVKINKEGKVHDIATEKGYQDFTKAFFEANKTEQNSKFPTYQQAVLPYYQHNLSRDFNSKSIKVFQRKNDTDIIHKLSKNSNETITFWESKDVKII